MMPVALENKVMTEEEVAKLWEAFQMFDEDGNSTLSAEELGQEFEMPLCLMEQRSEAIADIDR